MADSTTQIVSEVDSLKPVETGETTAVVEKEVVPDSTENTEVETPPSEDTQVEKNDVTEEAESNGDSNSHENGVTEEAQENGKNGHSEENGVEDNEGKEEEKGEENADEEPAAKKTKKAPKAKDIKAGSRRSSSRLVSSK